jgi:arginyl-tRNA synthetase
MIYLTDKRQDLYFEQVFRCAKKTKLVKPETELLHIGFGTMNGKDGKPYKTRQGGVPRLENLIAEINEEMLRKIKENSASKGYQVDEEEAARTSKIVGLAAIKYGDLSNQPAKDYVFDVDRFTSFEGDTGPYVLYTIVRIKSILAKYKDQGGCVESAKLQTVQNDSEKALVMELTKFNTTMEAAYEECAPNKICAYIYDLANQFNRFYHETPIISEADETKKAGWIALLSLTRDVLEACIEVLGFGAPERM